MRNFVMSTFAILLLAGCSNEIKESDYKFAGDMGAKVTFSAVINNQNASNLGRATATSWDAGDIIGITCGSKQVNVSYRYKANEGNYFEAVDGTREIWLMGTEQYDVSAYYPYTGTDGAAPAPLAVETTTANQATAADRQKLDFLYASGVANRENSNVQLDFNHVMSRIVLTFQGDGIVLKDIDCYISGLKLTGTFNTATGKTMVNEDAEVESVNQVLTDDNNHTMTAIFLPQKVSGKEILIEAGMSGIYYKVQLPVTDFPELKAGYSYNYTITAKNYSNEPIRLVITATQINPWTDVNGGTLTPDPGLAGTDAGITSPGWGDIINETVTPTEKK